MDSDSPQAAAADPAGESAAQQGLWTEEQVGTPRLPDPVRSSAVRAGLFVSFTLIEAVVALLGVVSGTWVAVPAVLCTVLSTVGATWAVVDVWVTRQVWNQRNGVVSSPSSAARASRREQRRERRAANGPPSERLRLISRA